MVDLARISAQMESSLLKDADDFGKRLQKHSDNPSCMDHQSILVWDDFILKFIGKAMVFALDENLNSDSTIQLMKK